ncbi:MAG TPA: RedB protein [Candidatus Polarisedimenticolia bacterium]|nr:RedB protein [Candidatus Polarisedimenticolia bacterium]
MTDEVSSPTIPVRHLRSAAFALGALWLAVVGSGMVILLKFATTPGDPGHAPSRWPEGSRISLASDRPTLVMAIHPRCPCTRASLYELEQVMARCRGQAAVHLLVVVPSGAGDDWLGTELDREAASIPGADLFLDRAGVEARRFGTATSGHTLVYNPSGALAFSGGITEARGHSGDNFGQEAVVEAIRRGESSHPTHFVFGCPLHDPPLPVTLRESRR